MPLSELCYLLLFSFLLKDRVYQKGMSTGLNVFYVSLLNNLFHSCLKIYCYLAHIRNTTLISLFAIPTYLHITETIKRDEMYLAIVDFGTGFHFGFRFQITISKIIFIDVVRCESVC